MPLRRVRGVNLHVELAGAGDPVLLLHGLGSSTADWEEQIPVLARHHRVIACDMRGHGLSDKPPGPYNVAGWAADTAALLEDLGAGPVHVVGLSMGGMIAFQLAADFPHLVKSLVIVNSGPELARSAKMRMAMAVRSFLVRVKGMRGWGETLSRRLFPKPEQGALRDKFVERMSRNDKQTYLAAQRGLMGFTVVEQLAAMTHPTLVISADQDYTPVSFKEEYVARMPNARLSVIGDSRHAVPLERPQEFNETVLRFLDEQRTRP